MRANVSMCCIALLGLVSVLGGTAQAQTTWTGAVDTDVTNAANWDSGLPASGNVGTVTDGVLTIPFADPSNVLDGMHIIFNGTSTITGTTPRNFWDDGVFTFNDTSSMIEDDALLFLGHSTVGGCTLNINDNADIHLDRLVMGRFGPATVNQNGGTVLLDEAYSLRPATLDASGFSRYNLSAGSLTMDGILTGAATATDYINFTTGSTGTVTDSGVSIDFPALVTAGFIRINDAVQTDMSGFDLTGTTLSLFVAPPPPAGEAGRIVASDIFAIEDEFFSLTAPSGATGDYTWSKDGGAALGTITQTLVFNPLGSADGGNYSVSFEDGLPKVVVNLSYFVEVLPSGTTLPLAGLLGLGLLASACAMGGASVLRRKK